MVFTSLTYVIVDFFVFCATPCYLLSLLEVEATAPAAENINRTSVIYNIWFSRAFTLRCLEDERELVSLHLNAVRKAYEHCLRL